MDRGAVVTEASISRMQPDHGATTLASTVYRKLRHDVIVGRLRPDAKLNIKLICEEFGSALSPVREALNRLAPEGLVRQLDNRGFVVASVSVREMDDLTLARCWINGTALRDAIEHADAAWEEAVVLSLHRLTRTPRGETEEGQEEWSRVHRDFHATLVSGCRSKRLLKYCGETFEAAERYRHIARRAGQQVLAKNNAHAALAQAAIDRDADLAVDLLERHFRHTAELVRAVLAASGP